MFLARRLKIPFCNFISKKGESAYTRVEVSFDETSQVQFFVPASSTVEQFLKQINRYRQEHRITEQISYEMDDILKKSTENFIDTVILNNFTLKIGKKILAYEIKEYEELYDYMPKYNAMLLEEFEKMMPTNAKVKDLYNLPLKDPTNWDVYQKPLTEKKDQYVSWYLDVMKKVKEDSEKTPKLMLAALSLQWIALAVITYGLYDWNMGQPISYISGITIDLLLFIGLLGMEQKYQKDVARNKRRILSETVTNFNAHMRLIHWRTLYLRKKRESLR